MPDQPAKAQRFETGDRVKLKSNPSSDAVGLSGEVGTVVAATHHSSGYSFYYVDVADRGAPAWHRDFELEPAPAAQGEGGDAK